MKVILDALGAGSAVLVLSAVLLLTGCFGPPSPAASVASPGPSPTLLPPPVAISSPGPAVILSPGPASRPVQATPIRALATPSGPAAEKPAAPERVTVVNTEGQGANLRAEPAANASLIRTLREGTELEIAGPDREAGGRRWRNVRAADGSVSGWIISDLLATAPGGAAGAANPAPARGGSPVARGPASPPAARAAGSPVSSGPSAGVSSGASRSAQRVNDADRAYLNAIQPHIEAIGKAIGAANDQAAAASGRPATLDDPAWRQGTQAAARQLADAAAGLRGAQPGPNTGDVRAYAVRAADRADEAAGLLTTAVDSRDQRSLTSVSGALVRVLGEVNNMNLALVQLQS